MRLAEVTAAGTGRRGAGFGNEVIAWGKAHVAAEAAACQPSFFDARQIPSVAYTDPEVAWAGLTEEQCQAQDIKFGKAVFPWVASGRAIANGRDEGFDALLLAFAETGQALVVMINANDNSGMMNRIVKAVARKYAWPERSSSAPAATKAAPPTLPLETVTGRYELSNNNMLTLVVHEGSVFSEANGLPDEEFLFMGDDRFG